MKRKSRPPSQAVANCEPRRVSATSPTSRIGLAHVTKQWLKQAAVGIEKNICDTPAWKDGVRRLGIKEARRRLWLHCLASQCPEANPGN
jgi:hypothetical protein